MWLSAVIADLVTVIKGIVLQAFDVPVLKE